MIKITVIIPNFNGIKYIGSCLESLYAQWEPEWDFTVMVVDNGSTDGSPDAVKQDYPQAALIRLSENTGFCHAVNVGIHNSSTPYVVLLNNDTIVKRGFIKNLMNAIEHYPKAFAVSAQMLQWDRPDLIDDAGDEYCVLGWAFARGKGKSASLYGKPARVFAACGGAAVYRRSVFEEIGYFDETHFAYLEDIDICYRARIYGYHSYYEPGARVLHLGSASSGSRYNEFKTKFSSVNSVYLIGKNMPIIQLLWNLPFLLVGFAVKTLFFFHKKMGMLYLRGLASGVKRCLSREGRTHKVKFRPAHLPHYFAIQWQLYLNVLRLIGIK